MESTTKTFDPYTLKINGMDGIEYHRRQSQFKFYWEPLAKMWGKVRQQNTIIGHEVAHDDSWKRGTNLTPWTIDTSNGLGVDEMGNDLVSYDLNANTGSGESAQSVDRSEDKA